MRTYYATIAQACRQRTLDTWQQADALQKELSRWLAAADLLVHDIAELREDERGLEAERNRLDTELSMNAIRFHGLNKSRPAGWTLNTLYHYSTTTPNGRVPCRKKHSAYSSIRSLYR